jgi:glutamate-5-semialdehyde dehydrogenase
VAEAVALFNALSPRFAAALISEDPAAHARFYETVDAPFVGDGFTRWVDGQYALNRPELGLSNWENGRLFARGGVLAGDGVFTVRARVRQADPHPRPRGARPPRRARADRAMWFAGPARRAPVSGRPQALRLGFTLAAA